MTYDEMMKEKASLGYDASKKVSKSQNKNIVSKSYMQNKQQPNTTNFTYFTYEDMLKEKAALGYKVPKVETAIKPNTIKPAAKPNINTPARPSQVPDNVKAPTYDTMGYGKLTDKKSKVPDVMRPASITSVGEYIHKAIGDKAYKDLPKVGFYRGQEKPKSNTGVFGMQTKEEIAASKAMGEWAEKYPKEYHIFMQIHNNDYEPTKGDAFMFGLGESVTLGLTDTISKLYDKSVSNQYNININDTRSDQAAKAYPKLSGAGKLLGYVSPGIAAEIPAKVVLKGVTKKVASKVAANMIEGAVIGGGLGAAEGVVRQEKPKEILKRAASNAAVGGVLGGGITATAGYFKGLRNSLKNPLNQNVPVKLEFVSAAVPDKVKPSSKGSWTVKNSEYNQALNDYNNAIELVHNEFKTNEFRTNEMPLVHQYLNEQGYNLDDILTRMEQSESKTSSQIMKSAAEKAKYKRAAGLGSEKVTKVIDNTLEMKPTMNMLNKKMFGNNFPVPGEQPKIQPTIQPTIQPKVQSKVQAKAQAKVQPKLQTEIGQELTPSVQPKSQTEPLRPTIKPTETRTNIPLEQGKSRFSQQIKYNSKLSQKYKEVAVEPDYTIVKDKAAWEYAKNRIKNDESNAVNELLSKTNTTGKHEVALATALIKKYSREGNYELANSINRKISLELTNAGQQIQAAKLLAKNTPAGMVRYARSEINKAVESIASTREKELLQKITDLQTKIDDIKIKQESLKSKPRSKNVISQLNELNNQMKVNLQLFGEAELKLPAKYKNARLTAADETHIMNKQEEIQAITDDVLRNKETARLQAYIANKIPITLGRKISTVQTLSQLLNFKTSSRNLVGNIGFAGLENVSQLVGRPIDKAIGAITKQRTNKFGFDVLGSQGKGLVTGAKAGFKDAIEGIDTAGFKTQYDIPSGKTFQGQYKKAYSLLKQGKLFKASAEMASATAGKAETGLSISLRTPDRAFYQSAFNGSIKNQMKVNGITKLEDVTEEMLTIAHQDGLYRTFQDTTLLSNAFTKLKRGMNLNKDFGFGDLVLKYPKTPANLLTRAIDYSPAGILKALYQIRNAGLKGGQKEIVESLSRATVGSGLMGASYLLYSNGILTGKRPTNLQAEELLKENGRGQYRFNVSAFNRFLSSGLNPNEAKALKGDLTVNYDWFQPSAVNVAAGANIGEQMKEKSKVNPLDVMKSVVYSSQSSIDTLAEQPLVQGIARMFQYGKPSENLTNAIAAAPASFVPTFVNQVRQLTDSASRETSASSNDLNGVSQKALNLIKNKIPGWSKTLPSKYSTTGKLKETYQNGNGVFNVFFNPAFVSKFNTTPGTQLILDLYDKTGDTKQFTKEAPDYITIENTNGKRIILTQNQKNDLQKFMGKTAIEELDKLSADPDFNTATDNQKVDIMGRVLQRVGAYSRKYLLQKLGEEYIVKNIK